MKAVPLAGNPVYDLVMKMDEDEARMFVTMATVELLWDDIEKNQALIDLHTKETIEKCLEVGRNAVHKGYIAKRMSDEDVEPALAMVGAFTEIEKAVKNQYWYGQQFDENQVRRNAQGQFTFKPDNNVFGNKPLKGARAQALGVPDPKKGKLGNAYKGLKDEKMKARYQSDYFQIAQALRAFGGNTDATITVTDKLGDTYTKPVNRATLDRDLEPGDRVLRVDVAPENLTPGQASFNLVGALGGSAQRAQMVGDTVTASDEAVSAFEREWNANTGTNSNDALYNRISAGSKLVGTLAPAGSQAQMAAAFASYVGQHGPEAEKVIGPTARKMAYRYRGTEKKPDAKLVRDFDQLSSDRINGSDDVKMKARQLASEGVASWQLREAKRRYPKARPAEQRRMAASMKVPDEVKNKIVAQAGKKARADEWTTSATTRSHARKEMADRLYQARRNKPGLYELQLSSGHVPPSEGIIIDRKGEIVSQAIGYADDHYLPFNLKNLKGLNGGEYIRTRSAGGPTAEDVYTGLMGNARAVTVVSRSGIFTIEFQDDFKGTRRYNDKAKRMVDRYEKLLDAVESKSVSKPVAIPKEVKDSLHEEVKSTMAFQMADEGTKRQLLKAREDEYRRTPHLTEADEATIEHATATFRAQNRDRTEQEIGRYEQELRNDYEASKELNFRLNGHGYEAALKALQEQFPYYIKSVKRETRGDLGPNTGAGAVDRGYVMPKHNRPAAAKAGYHAKEINGTGKVSAASVDYQNHRVRGGRAVPAPEGKQEGSRGSTDSDVRSGGSGNSAVDRAVKVAEERQRSREAMSVQSAAWPIIERLKASGRLPEGHEFLKLDEETFSAEVKRNGVSGSEYIKEIHRVYGEDAGKQAIGEEAYNALKRAQHSRRFNASEWTNFGTTPPKFDDKPAFKEGATGDQIQRELSSYSSRKTLDGTNFADIKDDASWMRELNLMKDLNREISLNRDGDKQEVLEYLSDVFKDRIETKNIAHALANPDFFPKQAESIQRVRRLQELARTPEAKASTSLSVAGSTSRAKVNDEPDAAKASVGNAEGQLKDFSDMLESRAARSDDEVERRRLKQDIDVVQEAIDNLDPGNMDEWARRYGSDIQRMMHNHRFSA